MHTYIWLIVWWSPSRDGDGICKLYIYIHMCVYTYVACVCANVYSVYMYVSMYPSLSGW